MFNYDFQTDLANGQAFEREVVEVLNRGVWMQDEKVTLNPEKKTRKYFDAYQGRHDAKKDGQIPKGKKYEIKLDEGSKVTGNVFFELFDPYDNRSGMMVTWAKTIIYGVWTGSQYKMFRTEHKRLMEFLFCYPCVWKGSSGDSGKTSGVIVPKHMFTGQPFVFPID